jgi:hypothetical protein
MKCELKEVLSSFLCSLLICGALVLPATIVGCAEADETNTGGTAVDVNDPALDNDPALNDDARDRDTISTDPTTPPL